MIKADRCETCRLFCGRFVNRPYDSILMRDRIYAAFLLALILILVLVAVLVFLTVLVLVVILIFLTILVIHVGYPPKYCLRKAPRIV